MNKNLKYIYKKARSPFKAIKLFIKKQLGFLGVPVIVPYTAYGNHEKIFITGAVVEDKGLAKPKEGQKLWKNILAMIKRYSGDEIAGARVKVTFKDHSEIVQTNEDGLFHTVLPVNGSISGIRTWDSIAYSFVDQIIEGQDKGEITGPVHFPRPGADFMVVSDIDDTVMISHSTKFFRKLRLMLFKNARTRSPFEGVAAFYKALIQPSNGGQRSVFYVSASEWNLYDLLVDFFAFRGIPRGPLLLSDTKMKLTRFWRSGKRHNEKVDKIKDLFEFYPKRDFILIGDSGQKDPEIYLEILEMFPSRVKAIYIRYIGSKKINRRLSDIIKEAGELGAEMILARSTIEAARHAAEKGYIRKELVEGIRSEKYFEEQKPVL